ncbi:MAG TPA: asparagine synthase (glutamine-hydrolyzing) [Anaerolineae bacterium]
MCGICGIVSLNVDRPIDGGALLQRMNDTMAHRGPDDAGHYLSRQAGMAMNRLRIIDLISGDQPIANEDRSMWIVFNGEIYNHQEIRRQLEQKGHVFQTKSDTEAIIHAYEEYGDDCVHHFNGMFGFAIWDSQQQRLLLARDRLGIKPMYYCMAADTFIFASELKAILAHPERPRDIDFVALDHFLTLEYIPSPRTIFKGIYKLPPGHRLILERGRYRLEQYWDVPLRPITSDDATCVEALTELIRDAVKIRLMADVPLGAFLSGGIDSSTVIAFMSEASSTPVRTFSIGFGDPTYNELPYARMVANTFGTRHHEEFLEPDITDLVLRLVSHFDEPFGDFSIFPTYLVSQVARKFVTITLSGDGGDEIFAGYDTYVAQRLANRYYNWLPGFVRQGMLPRLMEMAPPQPAKKGTINKAKRFIEGGALPPSLQHTRWMMFMHDRDKARLYRPWLQACLNGDTAADMMAYYFQQVAQTDALTQQQYVDVKTYLADDILTKVDRMSMAVSLEARVPLLDHRIVEFALNLPPHLKLNGNETKVILRRVMANRLPPAVLEKPKEGFSIPLKHWLRGELRPLMTDLLATDTVRRRGYFVPECVARWVSEHLERKANHSHRLWALMVFELWHRQIGD